MSHGLNHISDFAMSFFSCALSEYGFKIFEGLSENSCHPPCLLSRRVDYKKTVLPTYTELV